MEVNGNDVFFKGGGVCEGAFAGEELVETDDCGFDDFTLGRVLGRICDGAVCFAAFDGDRPLTQSVDVDRVAACYALFWRGEDVLAGNRRSLERKLFVNLRDDCLVGIREVAGFAGVTTFFGKKKFFG